MSNSYFPGNVGDAWIYFWKRLAGQTQIIDTGNAESGIDAPTGGWDWPAPEQHPVEDPKVKLEQQRKERLTKVVGKKRARWG